MNRRRIIGVALAAGMALTGFGGTVLAAHDHHIVNEISGTCATINVSHQDHSGEAPGKKFHGGLHTGVPGTVAFANPNNPLSVAGGACPEE